MPPDAGEDAAMTAAGATNVVTTTVVMMATRDARAAPTATEAMRAMTTRNVTQAAPEALRVVAGANVRPNTELQLTQTAKKTPQTMLRASPIAPPRGAMKMKTRPR